MGSNSKVLDLLLAYESLCRQGASPTPEELCRDRPDLLPEVRQGIARLQAGRPVFGPPGGPDTPPALSHPEVADSWANARPGAAAGAGAPRAMPTADDLVRGLPSAEWDELHRIVKGFEAAWRGGGRPDLEDHLPAGRPASLPLQLELARLDLAYRLEAGEAARAEDYLARFPELARHQGALFELVAAECEARRRREPGLTLEAYLERFSAHREGLRDWLGEIFREPLSRRLTWEQRGPVAVAPTADVPPAVAGYEVLGVLGHGGMGVVYKARHLRLNRLVALKMILAGAHAGPEARVRFLIEAEAVAALSHPGIVQVYEFGEHEGLPYFALELCPQGSLAARLNGKPLPPAEAARLGEQLGRAVQHAHERGIIHRDLKPANVLLGTDGAPKVTDFGLAKRVEGGAGLTQSQAQMGTPPYMAPEQVDPQRGPVTLATDVYGLGAILYECLTGRTPFPPGWDTLVRVLSDEPMPVRRLQPGVPADLETICHKCLHKEPQRRYASAADLADDLGRFRAGEAIHGRAVGRTERAAKWARRRPAVAALLLGLVLVTALGFAGVTAALAYALEGWGQADGQRAAVAEKEELAQKARRDAEKKEHEANEARSDAEKRKGEADVARERAEGLLHLNRIALADREAETGNHSRANVVLEECRANQRGWEWQHLRRRTRCGLPLFQLKGHTGSVRSVAFSPDGTRLASGSSDRTVKMWDAPSGAHLLTLKGHGGEVASLAFSPDGPRLASASGDQTVKVWGARSDPDPLTFKGHTSGVRGVAFSPDGSRLASASWDKTVRVWDARSGAALLTLQGHTNWVWSVAFSPDGSRLASASEDRTVKVWDARSGKALLTLAGHGAPVNGVAFSPDGSRLASASDDQTVKVWDARSGAGLLTLEGHVNIVNSVAFSPDGSRLASASIDKKVKVWGARSGKLLLTLEGHTAPVNGVAFSPDGSRLASASDDRTVKVWDVRSGADPLIFKGHTNWVTSEAFSPDGLRLASASVDKTVKVWDARSGEALLTLAGHGAPVNGVAFSPDGSRLASASDDRTVKVWDARSRTCLFTLEGHVDYVASVAFSPDGSRLASASWDGTVKVWGARSRTCLLTLKGQEGGAKGGARGVAFSPDGQRLAGASGWTVRVWDARSGADLLTLQGHVDRVVSVAFSPDGARVASASWDGSVKVWDARSGADLLTLRGHTSGVRSVAFSPDGARLASASDDQTVRVWDARTGAGLLALMGQKGGARGVAFSPDGPRLASGSGDKTVRAWDARGGADLLTLEAPIGPVHSVAFSADRRRIVAQIAPRQAGQQGEVFSWSTSTGARVAPCIDPPPPQGQLRATTPDGQATAWVSGHFVFVRSPPTNNAAAKARREAEDFQDTLNWHRQEARAAEEAGNWSSALFHFERLRHLRLGSASPRALPAQMLSRVVSRNPRDVPALLALARLRLAARDLPAFRLACAGLPEDGGDPLLARSIAWTCALAPEARRDLSPLLEAAEKDVAAGKDRGALLALGGLLLRAGRHDDALKRLGEARTARGPHALPAEELLLAIAYHKVGLPDEARRWLGRASAWLDGPKAARLTGHALGPPLAALPGVVVEAPDPRERLFGWHAWLEVQVLRREAEALLAAGRR